MSYQQEFSVVELVCHSDAPTRAVDAFTLSVVKMERQIRKLFTHLVFQCEGFEQRHVDGLKAALGEKRHFYFEGFERGINALFFLSVADLIGNEYDALRTNVDDAIQLRNKVFHGQISDRCLQRDGLLEIVDGLKQWCESLAEASEREIGYDGFARNSLQKGRPGLALRYKLQLNSVEEYAQFLDAHARRRKA